jgi:hypothetical protein
LAVGCVADAPEVPPKPPSKLNQTNRLNRRFISPLYIFLSVILLLAGKSKLAALLDGLVDLFGGQQHACFRQSAPAQRQVDPVTEWQAPEAAAQLVIAGGYDGAGRLAKAAPHAVVWTLHSHAAPGNEMPGQVMVR